MELRNPLLCVRACVCVRRAMRRPRCGLPDRKPEDLVDRKKRYVLTGQRWDKDHITYRFPDQMKQSDCNKSKCSAALIRFYF